MSTETVAPDSRPSISAIAITILYMLYSIGAPISWLYFSWQYAQANTFVGWFFLSLFFATFKSIFWPIFIWF